MFAPAVGFALSEAYKRVRRKRVPASTRSKRRRAYKRRKSKIKRRAKKYRKSAKAHRAAKQYKRYRKSHKPRKGVRLVKSDTLDSLATPIVEVACTVENDERFSNIRVRVDSLVDSLHDIINGFGRETISESEAIHRAKAIGIEVSTLVRGSV